MAETTSIRDAIRSTICGVDRLLRAEQCFGASFETMSTPLIESIEEQDDYAVVPYVIGHRDRYRSSPLATTLCCLWDAHLLSPEATRKMQKGLFFLRENLYDVDSQPNSTRSPYNLTPEDSPAWCVGEGASVWTTSMALIALFHTKVAPTSEEAQVLRNAVIWLAEQQDDSDGWRFQNHGPARVTVPMTALATRALTEAMASDADGLGHAELKLIQQTRDRGLTYLTNAIERADTQRHWHLRGQPSMTATAWAIQSLNEAHRAGEAEIDGAKEFLLQSVQTDITAEWECEKFVDVSGVRYGSHKNFYAFMPSHLPIMLKLGIPEHEPAAISIVQRLLRERETLGWKIPNYSDGDCSFAHAMALHALVHWLQEVGTDAATMLLEKGTTATLAAPADPQAGPGHRPDVSPPTLRWFEARMAFKLPFLATSALVVIFLVWWPGLAQKAHDLVVTTASLIGLSLFAGIILMIGGWQWKKWRRIWRRSKRQRKGGQS